MFQHQIYMATSDEPQTYQQAVKSDDTSKWIEVMEAEWLALWQQQTFEYTELPPGHKPIAC